MTDIAIVGVDCRFPQAPDPAALWRLLLAGADGITEVPADRWSAADFHDPDRAPGRTNTVSGGFLADADAFDHAFFGIPPREAKAMDPQQRLLLETAWRAFEDAALDPRAQAGTRTGVFVGVMGNEWAHVQLRDYERVTPLVGLGNGHFMTANRLSYQLDLHGPSVAVDTACSSSLVAVHLACQALRAGECAQALAAGVNLIMTPMLGVFYAQAGLSAPDGRCKPFSANANGIGRGEGVAVLVLRRLDEALAEGLPIYAVIKSGTVNADGRSNGIAAPNRWAQQDVVGDTYRRAGVEPADVGYVEAHGTGTVLGDLIEVKALGHVHGVSRPRPCAIGSIKGNLGHTEGAAGIAGLIKVAFALHHRIVPPSRYAETENARLRLAEHGLRLLTEPLELPADGSYAAVSSFGIGGTNAHLLLASAPTRPSSPGSTGGGVLTLSARDEAGLRRNAATLAEDLAALAPDQLASWCWTSNRVKASGPHRLAIPVRQHEDAVTALRAAAADRPNGWSGTVGDAAGAGWLFTGQGSQYPAMTAALHQNSGAYRRALSEVDDAMAPALGGSVRELILSGDQGIAQTGAAQPALFAVQYALSRVFAELGVEPAWLVGHSVGEYAAAAHAGVFELDDACRLIVERGRLMQALPSGGGMLAVHSGSDALAELLGTEPEIAVAAVNAPDSVVLSGNLAALRRIAEALAARGIPARELDVSHAFHSTLMAPALAEFTRIAAGIGYRAPRIPLYSTLHGRLLGPDDLMDAAYWTDQIVQPVRFAEALNTALDHEVTHLLEIGPRRVLTPLAARIRPGLTVESLTPCPGPDATGDELADVVAALYRDGVDPNWDALYEPEQRSRHRLPGYRFAPSIRSWIPAPEAPAPADGATPTEPEPQSDRDSSQPTPVDPAAPIEPQPARPEPAQPEPARTKPGQAELADGTPAAPANPSAQLIDSRQPQKVQPTMESLIALFREQTAVLSALALADPGHTVQPAVTPFEPGPDTADRTPALGGIAVTATDSALPEPAGDSRDTARIAATVTEQVARVSGFPAGTLEPAQTLGADLGFDSIMAVDLVNGLMKAFPGLSFDSCAATDTTTLGDLIDHVTRQLGGPEPSTVADRPAADYRIEEFPEVKAIADRLARTESVGVANPYFLVNDGITADTSIVDGREVVNFASYNYLGLSGHPAVVGAVRDAVARFGSSCSASRVLSGEKPVHRELEAELAGFLGCADAIALVSGHATNVTVIGHLVGPGDLVVHDALAHDSILQGAKLSGATRRPFPHNDHAALDRLLTAMRHQYRRVLVLIEGAYSQDGDIPDLPAFLAVKRKHHALLMIDEAHSIGVLGATGRGIGEHFDVDRADVELWSGTMSKALAGCGGYVAGSAALIRFLKYTAPGFVYSVGMTPPNAAASLAALRQLVAEPSLLTRLHDRSALFLELARKAGLNTGDSAGTPIIPCIVGDSLRTVRLSNALLRQGINVNPILYPAVPEELARLRFFVTAQHSEDQIRRAVEVTAAELATMNSSERAA